MHPDLSPHLHTPKCNDIVRQLQKCHAEYPFRKFFGKCNPLNAIMNKCLYEERLANRKKSGQRRNTNIPPKQTEEL